ncbi:phycoerythrobilin:ferredoxin oxidoreductase [Prochlorococcus marinus]|uniref:Phycoerythrobilin:ferredoxin oxidoreductase n=1 Tax=Prochlorococcus marinus XMU1408 TaxID=2213228 RepID=A0A318R0F7_PROMR|nr:phycoerythrobilin:ferredoxin oxidoreductase [Prochlorococcus marinus]MBW3042816.1 phycoerythrobilin:ferredoxin oxidoreductase [Prochlorococcus marinus str. XMU1408]PYE00643.1 phycoerythrobilin:ferredoxin oxidoreductase [Prochlorococcus marinus XMU1408]
MQSNRNNSLEPISISNWRWSYFLDETIKGFSIFQPRFYPIENDFLFRKSEIGSSSNPKKVILETWGLKTEKIRKARCACLQAGEITSVMNLVASPLNNYDLPFFGADFVTLPNGHLIALDLQPALKDDAKHTQYVWDKLIPIHAKWQSKLPSGGDIPSEARQYFSPAFLWSRIPLGDEGDKLISQIIKPAFDEYLNCFLDLVRDAKMISKERSFKLLNGQKKYMRYRAEKDPARGMLRGFFGEQWTENYINNILFDLK